MSPEYIHLEDHDNIQFEVQIQITPEAGQFLAYSQSLEVSAFEKSEIEAESILKESVSIVFKELIERGSLVQVLFELVWKQDQTLGLVKSLRYCY